MPALLLSPTVWLAVACAVLGLAVHHYRSELLIVTAQYEAFEAKTEALGEQAKAHKVEKEAHDKAQIADAVTGRNDALARLRVTEAGAGRSRVSLTPAAPAGSSQICFEPVGFAAAIERYRQRVAGIVIQGDEAQIDAQTLLKAWPK